MHHRIGGSGGLPSAPPPPLISQRSSRGSGTRTSGRSRSHSRSRSPHGRSSGRYRNERDSRDVRDRERERERDRTERRRSVSPPFGNRSERDRDRRVPSSAAKASSSAETLPSISLIQSDAQPSIIRRILNPEDVKIPRRVNEGSKPIFERDELKEAMRRRMVSNDNEENPPQSNAYVQDTPMTQQRVVAIIREPVSASDIYPNFSSSKSGASQSTSSNAGRIHRVTSDSPPVRTSSSGYNRRSRSPSPKDVRRHASPPPVSSNILQGRSRSIDRERERERLILLERERERERGIQRLIAEREREPIRGPPVNPRERELRDMRHMDMGRPMPFANRGDHRRNDDIRAEIERERDRDKGTRFSGPSTSSQPPHPLARRSRSPISRVPREDIRLRRRSRSHSQTPPPMPVEFRRQIIERQRNIDLRSSLSRQPGKFGSGDDRPKGRPPTSNSIRGSGRGGGRGGFSSRGGRGGRDDERRVWVHDMYEEDEPKKIN